MPAKKKPAKKTPPRTRKKAWPNWVPLSGAGGFTSKDWWGRKEPQVWDLLSHFDDVVFSCINLIINQMAKITPRLMVKTEQGQRAPKCRTRPLSSKSFHDLLTRKRLGRGTIVEEVLDHPAIDLMNKGSAYHNYNELVRYTQLFQEITGDSFWLLQRDYAGVNAPSSLVILLPQYMQPERDDKGMIKFWKYNVGIETKTFMPDEIIHFKTPNPLDPYGMGYSPLKAAFNRVRLGYDVMGFLGANLQNNARPDWLLSPEGDQLGDDEAERYLKDLEHRFRGQGQGGVFMPATPFKATPLSWPPKDFAELNLYTEVKTATCNVFGIPPDALNLGQANRSSADAVLYAMALHCIAPRMQIFLDKLNERLIPLYDDRLFFDVPTDEIIPEDRQFQMQRQQMLLAQGVITRDEVRLEEGYESAEWATAPVIPPGSVVQDKPEEATSGDVLEQVQEGEGAAPGAGQGGTDATDALRATVGGSQLCLQIVQMVNEGKITREQGINNLIEVLGFAPDKATRLIGEPPPKQEQPAQDPLASIGLARKKKAKRKRVIKFIAKCNGDDCEECKEGKCGGEGGEPGPCPENKPDAPSASKPAASDKPAGQQKPKQDVVGSFSENLSKIGEQIADEGESEELTAQAQQHLDSAVEAITTHVDDKMRAHDLEKFDSDFGEEVMSHPDAEKIVANYNERLDGIRDELTGSLEAVHDELSDVPDYGTEYLDSAIESAKETRAQFGQQYLEVVEEAHDELRQVEIGIYNEKADELAPTLANDPHANATAVEFNDSTKGEKVLIETTDGWESMDYDDAKSLWEDEANDIASQVNDADDAEHYNEQFAEAGNPYRIVEAEGGGYTYIDKEDMEQEPEKAKAVKAATLDVPDVQQQYPYDCGAAATMAVCQFFGVGPATEDAYIAALGTTEADGTPPENIIKYLGDVGLEVEARNDLTIPDLAQCVSEGRPVICPIQDYEEAPQEIPQEKAGHYVVVVSADDDNIGLQDPSAGRVTMPTLDFLARWEDTDEVDEYVHFGIACSQPQGKCGGEGGTPGPCAGPGHDEPSTSQGAATIHAQADKPSKSLAERARELPAKVYNKAKEKVAGHYEKLAARYGKGMAIAIVGAGIVGTAAPLPGTTIIAAAPLIALAELYRAMSGKKADEGEQELSEDELMKLGKEFVSQLLEEWGKENEVSSQDDDGK